MRNTVLDDSFIPLNVDIVEPNIPSLISPEILDIFKLVTDNVENKLEGNVKGWKMPVLRRKGH